MTSPSTPLKTILFSVLIPGALVIGLPWLIVGHDSFYLSIPWAFRFVGMIMIGVGFLGYLNCAWTFTTIGRGTPAIWDPPSHLVSRFLYHRLRNPMYVSLVTIVAGEAAFFRSTMLLWVAMLVAVCFHVFVVIYEEPVLKRTFGTAYEEYCQDVNRWWPKLRLHPSRHA